MKNFIIYAPDIFSSDAIGNYCLSLSEQLSHYFDNIYLFSCRFAINLNIKIQKSENLFDFDLSDCILLINYSIYDPLLYKVLSLNCKKIIYYHGVTPYKYFSDWDEKTEDMCKSATDQLLMLKNCDILITNSNSSRNYLSKYINTLDCFVIPPVIFNHGIFRENLLKLTPPKLKSFQLIMLGRVSPHKNIEDGLLFLKHLILNGTDTNLVIIGAIHSKKYFNSLINLAKQLNILNNVQFTGSLSDKYVLLCLKNSNLLLSMSKHEGFGVPILEAMYLGLPILVRSGTATDEFAFSSIINPAELINPKSNFYKFNFLNNFLNKNININKKISRELLLKTTAEKYMLIIKKVSTVKSL
jgi:glycosyltransferase involved in cell wall biosynthesis